MFFAATTAGRSWRGAVEELEARARDGHANTWAYQLDWYPRDVEGGELRRAFHTLDIPLVFDNIAQPGSRAGTSAGAQAVADAMRDALLAFARNGDPRAGATSAWAPYSLERRESRRPVFHLYVEAAQSAVSPRVLGCGFRGGCRYAERFIQASGLGQRARQDHARR